MTKLQTLGVALLAVMATGLAVASGASASKWLSNGAEITTAASADTSGTWTLTGLQFFGFVETVVECDGLLLGTVGPGAKDQVTGVENLAKTEKGTIDCEVSKTKPGGCMAGTLALVTALNLPWDTELLAGSTKPVDHFSGLGSDTAGKEVAFKVECTLSNGSKSSETCEGNVLSKELVNNATTKAVEGTVLNTLSKSCSGGGVAHSSAKGSTKLVSGSTLTVDN